jgi:hypothetical protein
MSKEALHQQDVMLAAREVAHGTGWTVLAAERSAYRDAWLVLFEHERGDRRTACFSEGVPLELALRSLNYAVSEPLPFPAWKKGEPWPAFTLPLPFDALECERTDTPPDIGSFEPGMALVVTMVDTERMTVTLVPQGGPWWPAPDWRVP